MMTSWQHPVRCRKKLICARFIELKTEVSDCALNVTPIQIVSCEARSNRNAQLVAGLALLLLPNGK